MKKRFLTMFLALVMCLAMLPTAALAANSDFAIEDGVQTNRSIYGAALANPGDTATAENVLAVLSKYDADAYHIMKTEYDRGTNILIWFFGSPIISRIETAVHETYHGYTFHQSGKFYSERIYLGGGKFYDVDYSIVNNSGNFTKTEEMARNIPSELRTFRYDTYAAPGASTDANTNGVFGLLNEFTAYCWGLETMNSLTQYLLDTGAGAESWKPFVTGVGNNMTAYAEFKYWTLRYMIYIKSANPTLYQAILNNEPYCSAYRDAEEKFTAEIARSRSIVDSCQDYLRGKGCSVDWSNSGIYLRSGYSGTGLDLGDYNVLMAELAKPEYVEMDSILKKNSPQQPTTPDKPVATAQANPTTQKLLVNGKEQIPAAYNINNNNYFKIRDVAALLIGTDKGFNVDYVNGAVTIFPNQAYEKEPTDLQGRPTASGMAMESNDVFYCNGEQAPLGVYKVNNTNYVMLRDLAKLLDFCVEYDETTRSMIIDTTKPYTE